MNNKQEDAYRIFSIFSNLMILKIIKSNCKSNTCKFTTKLYPQLSFFLSLSLFIYHLIFIMLLDVHKMRRKKTNQNNLREVDISTSVLKRHFRWVTYVNVWSDSFATPHFQLHTHTGNIFRTSSYQQPQKNSELPVNH